MHDRKPRSIAARVLIDLNNDKKSKLYSKSITNPNISKKGDIKTVTITNILAVLFNPKSETFNNIFDMDHVDFSDDSKINEIKDKGKDLVDNYFKNISEVFDNDWQNSDSNVFSSKYFSAFCLLFLNFKQKSLSDSSIRKKLVVLKTRLLEEISKNNKDFDKQGSIFINNLKGVLIKSLTRPP